MKNFVLFVITITIIVISLIFIAGCSDNPVNSNIETDKSNCRTNTYIIELIDINNNIYNIETSFLTYNNSVLNLARYSFPIDNITSFKLTTSEWFQFSLTDINSANYVYLSKGLEYKERILHISIKGCGIAYPIENILSFSL